MNPRFYVPLIDGLGSFIFFVLDPVMFAAIGYWAWKGRPETFDRSRYGVLAVVTFLTGCIFLLFGKWINADVRAWQYVPQVFLMIAGLLLIGLGSGCGLAFVTYRRRTQSANLR